MKFGWPEYDIRADFSPRQPLVLSVEHPTALGELIQDWQKQVSGEGGGLYVWDGERDFALSKRAELILNPFVLEMNSKKVLNQIHRELTESALTEFYEETAALRGRLARYWERLLAACPYDLVYEVDVDMGKLLKTCGIRVDDGEGDFFIKIDDYVKALHRICGVDLFVFLNLKQFVPAEKLAVLYQSAAYEQVSLILLEGVYRGKLETENNLILDQDCCMIQV